MKTTIRMIGVLVVLCLSAPGDAWLVVRDGELSPLDYYRQQIAELTERVYQAKLDQIALFIEAGSKGEKRLLLEAGGRAPADARAAIAEGEALPGHAADREVRPPIEVYPVSSPLAAKLPETGDCRLLGAATLRVEAKPTEGEEDAEETTAKPDVYLLAYGTNGRWMGDARLISLAVDDGGRLQFEEVLRTPAQCSRPSLAANRIPSVMIRWGEGGKDAKDGPARRAKVQMTWAENTYRFELDLLTEEGKK